MTTASTIGWCIFALFVLICVFIMSLSTPKEIELLKRLPNTEVDMMRQDLEIQASKTRYGQFYQKHFASKMLNGGLEKYAKMVGIDIAKTEQDIYAARLEDKISVGEIVSMKLIGIASLVIFVGISALANFEMTLLVIGFLLYYICSFYPSRMITSAVQKRRESILLSLPGFIELVYSVIEAGSTIQDALTTVATKTPGPLSEEFLTVTARTKVSGKWKQEMELMAERSGVEQLGDLVADILISHEKGTSIVAVLRDDAEQLRAIKNAKVMEKAKRLTSTILIPMALFSFLPMFGLMLMPMLIQFMENF